MKVAVWIALWLLSGLLAEPGRLNASGNLVDLVLLFDSTQLQDKGNRWRAAELGRDVVNNLPPRVGVQAFRFGRNVVPLNMDSLTAESLAGAASGNNQTTLPRALLEMERHLCGQIQAESSPGKALVVVGRGTGNEWLELAGTCQITVYGVSASSENDPILRELSERTHGAYYSLARTKGYTVSKAIRVKSWLPSLLRRQRSNSDKPEEDSRLWFQVFFLFLFAVLLASLVTYLRSLRSGSFSIPTREPPKPSIVQGHELGPEAGLAICSETGPEKGIFWFRSEGAFILGGKQNADSPQSNLVCDDPLLTGEHCMIYLETGRFFAADMESDEGTFVNGEKLLEPRHLLPGDELKVGSARFKFIVDQA